MLKFFLFLIVQKWLQRIDNFIKDEGVTSLERYLKENKSLTSLDLSDNLITNKGLGYVCESLINNYSLKILNVRNNNFQMME